MMALRHTGEPTHSYAELRSDSVFRVKYWWMPTVITAEHKDGRYWKVDIPFECSAVISTDPDGVPRISLAADLHDPSRVVLKRGVTQLEPDDEPDENEPTPVPGPEEPEPQPEPNPEPEPEPNPVPEPVPAPEPVPVPGPVPLPSLAMLTVIREEQLARYRASKVSQVISKEGLTNLPIIRPSGIPGAWQVAAVVHLPGDVNAKNHSIFVTAVDETTTRPISVQLLKGNSGGPLSFTGLVTSGAVLGAEVPMVYGDTLSVAIGEFADVVDNLTPNHPATSEGNPGGFHSFYIIYIKQPVDPEPSDDARLAGDIGTATSHAIAHWRLYGGPDVNTEARVSMTNKTDDIWRIIAVKQVSYLHNEMVVHVRDASEPPLDVTSVKNLGRVIETVQINRIIGARIPLHNTGPYTIAEQANITFTDPKGGYIVVVQRVEDLPEPAGPARIVIIERGRPGIIRLGPPENREVVFWANEERFDALWGFLVTLVEGGIPND